MMPLATIYTTALDHVLLHSRMAMLAVIPLLILFAIFLPYRARRCPLLLGLLALVIQTATLFHPSFAMSGGLILESRIIFIGLVSIYICILLLPRVLRQPDRRPFSTAMLLAFLLFYAAGTVILTGIGNPGVASPGANSHVSVDANALR